MNFDWMSVAFGFMAGWFWSLLVIGVMGGRDD